MHKDTMNILVSIGGGPEAYEALAFAALLSRRQCTDTSLLTVREPDSGLHSGGLELRVAREQMLGWGLELPGLKRLKKARDIFAELGEIPGQESVQLEHRAISGDPAGEYVVSYNTPCGGTVALHLRSGTDIPGVIAEQCDIEDVDIAIVGAPGENPTGFKKLVSATPMAYRIAQRLPCPIIIARRLKAEGAILAVLDGSGLAAGCLPRLAKIARACGIPLSVASTAGMEVIEKARRALPLDSPPIDETFEVENSAEAVLAAAEDYTLVALPAPVGKLRGSMVEKVMENAPISVMIIR